MLSVTTQLLTFLNGNTQGESIPAITLTLTDGNVYRWCMYQTATSFGGTTWNAHGQGGYPLIIAYRARTVMGLDEIATLDLEVGCGGSTTLVRAGCPTIPWQKAAADGVFDGATLLLERLYRALPTDAVVGKLYRFQGIVRQAPPNSHGIAFSVESPVARLQQVQLPKTLISASCVNALFDGACGLSKAPWQVDSTVVAAQSNRTTITANHVAWPDDYWNLGYIVIGSGSAAVRRGIRESRVSQVTLTNPLPAVPADGTPIKLTVGCDHTVGPAGCGRFSNWTRFRGQPNLPKE